MSALYGVFLWLNKYVSAATDKNEIMDDTVIAMFSMRSVSNLHDEDPSLVDREQGVENRQFTEAVTSQSTASADRNH
jgi:hypothetical protein